MTVRRNPVPCDNLGAEPLCPRATPLPKSVSCSKCQKMPQGPFSRFRAGAERFGAKRARLKSDRFST